MRDKSNIPAPTWKECHGEVNFKIANMLYERGIDWREQTPIMKDEPMLKCTYRYELVTALAKHLNVKPGSRRERAILRITPEVVRKLDSRVASPGFVGVSTDEDIATIVSTIANDLKEQKGESGKVGFFLSLGISQLLLNWFIEKAIRLIVEWYFSQRKA